MAATGTITLAPVDDALRPAVMAIAVAPEQVRFGGVPAQALAAAARETARESVAILRDGVPVGFFQLDTRSVPGAPAAADVLGLRALAIDRAAQGQGVGTGAMLALPAYVRARFPRRRFVVLTVNLDNPAGLALYRRTGFMPADGVPLYQGGRSGPQQVLILDVSPTAQ
jgi:ribosomal protein S18 acetylase RimI-like enzyme